MSSDRSMSDRRAKFVRAGALLLAVGVGSVSNMAQAQTSSRGSIDARVARLERQLSSSSMFELLDRIEALQRDVQVLRGEIEIQGHDLAEAKGRQRKLSIELDKVANTNSNAPATPAGGEQSNGLALTPAPVTTAEPAAPVAAATLIPPAGQGVDPFLEQSAYSVAFNLLQEGRYEKAATAFTGFLKKYPKGQYADNAQYWLGETYYVTRNFPRSMEEFNKLVEQFPSSQKLPGARLKIGFIHQSLGQLDKARTVLEDLVRRYPKSTPARLARDRLKQLGSQ
ncbi:MAG: tol-pal system protein YbgF [Gammaproteobacteria bacterium]|jgi:tol-pal system protein YbgF